MFTKELLTTLHIIYIHVFVCYVFVVRRKIIDFTAQFTLMNAQLIFLHKHVILYQLECCFASIDFLRVCFLQAGGELLYLWGGVSASLYPVRPLCTVWFLCSSFLQVGGELLYLWGGVSAPLYPVRPLPGLLSAEVTGTGLCCHFWKGEEVYLTYKQ